MRAFPKILSQILIAPASDKIIGAFFLPPGCTWNGFWMEHSMMATAPQLVQYAYMYGVDAYVIPIDDPDTNINLDILWDESVPKDTAVGSSVLDMDTAGSDTTPRFELGELNPSDLVGLSTVPAPIMTPRRQLITFPKMPVAFHLDPADPGTAPYYIPTDYYRTRSRQRHQTEVPAVVLIGVSSPDYANTQSFWTALQSTSEWLQLKYLGETQRDAWTYIAGLVSAGTQESASEAATLLETFMEKFYEENAGAFGGDSQLTWKSFAKITADISLTGYYEPIQLGGSL